MKMVSDVPQPPTRRGAGGAINNAVAQAAIWSFYRTNPDRVLIKVGGFIKIRVKDLRVLFELLAGPEPT
jgi:hypothetical protein